MPDPGRPDFLTELRRRGVLGTVALYLAGAWVAIEVADTVFPRLGLPDAGVTVLIWAAVLGLPLVALLAWSYRLTPDGPRREGAEAATIGSGRLVGLVVVLVAMGAAGALTWNAARGGDSDAVALDPSLAAVLPFRTSGAQGLDYLREGLVDLLATKLTGEPGPRAVGAATVLAAWRAAAGAVDGALPDDSARAVARSVGAARAIAGHVVGTADAMVVDVRLEDTRTGETLATASESGPADSLTALVDRLAASLLSQATGELDRDAPTLAALTSTSLPALRAYLAGESAFRRGDYAAAVDRFNAAIDTDSTFALAGFGLYRAAAWTSSERAENIARGMAVAWRHRDRLGEGDRALLVARAGPRYPEESTTAELLEARRRAVDLLPDRAEAWYELADHHFHYGLAAGLPRPMEDALEGFRRAMQLDPGFAGPAQHVATAAGAMGDTALLAFVARSFAVHDPTGETARYIRWRLALARDPAELERLQAEMDDWAVTTLRWIGVDTQDNGLPGLDGWRAVRARADRAATRGEQLEALLGVHAFALHLGRPADALDALRRIEPVQPDEDFVRRHIVLDALFAGGDSAAAAAAAAELRRRVQAGESAVPALDGCAAALWVLYRGEDPAPGTADAIRREAGDDVALQALALPCAPAVEASAAEPGSRAWHLATARMDTMLREVRWRDVVDRYQNYHLNLVLADLLAEAGDTAAALAAARRRSYFGGWSPYAARFFLTQARLAGALGLDEEAEAAYRKYLDLRADPEPAALPEVERARRALQQLGSS